MSFNWLDTDAVVAEIEVGNELGVDYLMNDFVKRRKRHSYFHMSLMENDSTFSLESFDDFTYFNVHVHVLDALGGVEMFPINSDETRFVVEIHDRRLRYLEVMKEIEEGQELSNMEIGEEIDLRFIKYLLSFEEDAETEEIRRRKCKWREVVRKYHMKAYDTLFAHLDKVYPDRREVYLGRDGIYAYLARKYAGYDCEYLVFPRRFKGSRLGKDYLMQKGIDQSCIFIDTGFSGSIPEAIGRTLCMDTKAVLLSSDKDEYRLPRSPVSRDEIVPYFEHAPKPTLSAIGLHKVGEKIMAIEPTSPKSILGMFEEMKDELRSIYMTKSRDRDYEEEEEELHDLIW